MRRFLACSVIFTVRFTFMTSECRKRRPIRANLLSNIFLVFVESDSIPYKFFFQIKEISSEASATLHDEY